MKLYEKAIIASCEDGNRLKLIGLCSAIKSQSLDESIEVSFTVQYVLINNQKIKVEGYGYFYHPETGKLYEI